MAVRVKPITEDEFLGQVIDLARLRGWRVAHFRPARTANGWRTAVQADGVGFPDLILTRHRDGRIAAAELKVGRNRLTPEQADWLAWFEAAGVPAFEWRPERWAEIEEFLE